MMNFDEAYEWASGTATTKPNVILGNGFSMAYNPELFGYSALAAKAAESGEFPAAATAVMTAQQTQDFERVMRQLSETADTLSAIDPAGHSALIKTLRHEVAQLRESLALAIAALHPDRPYDVDDEAYKRVRTFLGHFHRIFSVNYDLLLYWALMQEFDDDTEHRTTDDGFRDSGIEGDETVLWNIYDTGGQIVYYMHGALHLFEGPDGLRKITFVRTNRPLIDQVRDQLAARRYPLYVAEGDSASKISRISESGYLTRGLRSIAACNAGIVVFGHSLDPNDNHIFEAVVRSGCPRLAVSIYGDAKSTENLEVQARAQALIGRRAAWNEKKPLEVGFFDAATVHLWNK